jgi:hypothetical protein
VAGKIWTLFAQRPDFVWEVLERGVRELPTVEETAAVLGKALYDNWFWFLRDKDVEEVSIFLQFLSKRVNGDLQQP